MATLQIVITDEQEELLKSGEVSAEEFGTLVISKLTDPLRTTLSEVVLLDEPTPIPDSPKVLPGKPPELNDDAVAGDDVD